MTASLSRVIDLKKLRDEETYRDGVIRKGIEPSVIHDVLHYEEVCRKLLQEVEELRSLQNAASKEIGRASPEQREEKIAEAASMKESLQSKENEYSSAVATLDDLTIGLPNPASERCPSGGEEDYEVVEIVGDCNEAPSMNHAEYGEFLEWVETEKAAENMGSRFAYLKNEAVLLEFALIQYTMSKLVSKGFIPVVTPVLVREQMMIDAGFFPTDRNQVYELPKDDLFLTGTSEVALAGLHRGDLLDEENVPARYVGYSSCFRREAGTYGKDTSGIFRVHQFDKVEMFSFCDPEKSNEEHEYILTIEEEILQDLEIPYRVVDVCTGDLGASAAKKYDIEAWIPSQQKYREVTSCSNTTDFQARRLNMRTKIEDVNTILHTLNGTALAVGRILIALLENNQQPDGSVMFSDDLGQILGVNKLSKK